MVTERNSVNNKSFIIQEKAERGIAMKEWEIKDYKNQAINWGQVPVLTIDQYPWYEKGLKQKTEVKIAISKDNIYIHAKAEDKHIRSRAKNLNDPVHEDSCFEFFVSPWPEKSESYFNIEMNCTGVLYMAYHEVVGEKLLVTKEQAEQITIESSLAAVEHIAEEKEWELKVVVPISLLEEMSGKKIEKDIWYGNFYRCGGEEDDQYAAWNPLESKQPNYHLPMQFGKLIIKE